MIIIIKIIGSSFHDEPVIKTVPSSLPMAMPMFMRFKQEDFCGLVSHVVESLAVSRVN